MNDMTTISNRQVGRTLSAITADLRIYVRKANEVVAGGERNAKQVLQDAEMAAREYRYKAGVCLIEAKASPEMADFPSYAKHETGVDPRTYQTWMQGGRILIDHATTKKGKNGERADLPSTKTLRGDTRTSSWQRPYTSMVDATIHQAEKAMERLRERELDEHREQAEVLKLAKQIVDIGYKALATKLHPDKGGDRAQMTRLTEAKKLLLKAVQ